MQGHHCTFGDPSVFFAEVELDELEVLKKPAAKTGLNAVVAYGY